jgi:hypothetical protein
MVYIKQELSHDGFGDVNAGKKIQAVALILPGTAASEDNFQKTAHPCPETAGSRR